MSRAEDRKNWTDAAVSQAANDTPALVPLAACLGIFHSQSLPVCLMRLDSATESAKRSASLSKLSL